MADAAVHDSQAPDALTLKGDPETWLHSGYSGQPCPDVLAPKSIAEQFCEKGVRGKLLTRAQNRLNRRKSKKIRVWSMFPDAVQMALPPLASH